MNPCPCCANPLLRHARHNHIYWFCQHCRQEMPNLSLHPSSHQRSLTELDALALMPNSIELR